MRFIIFVMILILGVCAQADGGLPTQGRSDFDLLIAKNGNTIPNTFEGLWRLVNDHSLYSGKSSFIPHGRSLQRNLSDFASPRVLYTNGESSSGYGKDSKLPTSLADLSNYLPQANIFLAYTKRSNTVEVISYNETLGRYEFQIIRNFGPGLEPKLMYTPRGLCLSCHQNEGPIFSHFPWNETDHNFAVNREMRRTMPFAETHGLLQVAEDGTFTETTTSFDLAVRRAAKLLGFQKLWHEGCGPQGSTQASTCHRLILEMMLVDPQHRKPSHVQELEAILRGSWPRGGLQLVSSELIDRTTDVPFDPKPTEPIFDPLQPLQSTHFPILKDPGNAGITAVFSFSEVKLIKEQLTHQDVSEILSSPEFDAIWANSIFNRRAFIETLSRKIGQTPSVSWSNLATQVPAAVLDKFEVQADGSRSSDPRLRYFRQYCSECHSGSDATDPFNFMSAQSDDALIVALRSNPQILKRLEWKHTSEPQQMPPIASALGRHFRDHLEKREEMIRFLTEGKTARPMPKPELCEEILSAPKIEAPSWTDKFRSWLSR